MGLHPVPDGPAQTLGCSRWPRTGRRFRLDSARADVHDPRTYGALTPAAMPVSLRGASASGDGVNDLESALLNAITAFARARLEALLDQIAHDGEALLGSLLGRLPTPAELTAYETKAAEVDQHLGLARQHLTALGALLAPPPSTLGGAQAAVGELGAALTEVDAAIDVIASVVPQVGDVRDAVLQAARKAIAAGGDALSGLAAELGLAQAGASLADGLASSPTGFTYRLANAAARDLLDGPGARLTLSDTTLDGHFDYRGVPVALGAGLKTGARAGLTADALVGAILPAAADLQVDLALGIDTATGLTFGAGLKHRVSLPGSIAVPGVDLHDLGLGLPDIPSAPALELTGTLAGKLGPLGAVIEGAGLRALIDTDHLLDHAGPVFSIGARLPTGAGLDVDAGVVRGGGFLQHAGTVYSGALDLRIGPVEVKAFGLLDTAPFSFVVVMSVEFFPAIQLSFGFTLNAVGGLLAINRTLSTDALVAGLRNHTAELLLFPKDPAGSAPAILTALAAVFPAEPGGFVVGPMFELGWGAPVSFVTAKVGIVISLPDPKLVLLGALRVALPAPEVPLIDLRASVFGELTPKHLLILVSLDDSRIAGFAVSGDLGVLIVVADSPDFAISAGGFHPHYQPPAELAGMRRVRVDISPPVILTLRAEAYVALTSNSVQLGARVELKADAGVVGAEGHIGFDAMVQWAPKFLFLIDLDAGIALYAFGESFAGVDLHLHLEGPGPWIAKGTASVSLLFFDVDLDVGPLTWGSGDNPAPAAISPMTLVFDALKPAEAWTAQLPPGTDMLVRLLDVATDDLLVHPLGAFEARQTAVPLETTIDRVGRNPVTVKRVNLGAPRVGGLDAKAFSHATDRFAPGQFLDLTADEKLSRPAFEERPAGLRLAGVDVATRGAPVESIYEWETTFPHRTFSRFRDVVEFSATMHAAFLASGAVSMAAQKRTNPYAVAPDRVRLADPGEVEIRRRSDLGAVATAAAPMATVEAYRVIGDLVAAQPELAGDLQVVGAGVAR